MACVYGARADHGAFSAEEAAFEEAYGLFIAAVLQGQDGAAHAGLYKFAGGAAGGAASAGHTFEHVGLNFGQLCKFLPVHGVQVYSGAWAECKSEFSHCFSLLFRYASLFTGFLLQVAVDCKGCGAGLVKAVGKSLGTCAGSCKEYSRLVALLQ